LSLYNANLHEIGIKARAVKLAVESNPPFSRTAEELGVNKNTLPTWIGKYHRANPMEKKVGEAHLYEELKRLKKERAILKKAAGPLPRKAREVRLYPAPPKAIYGHSDVPDDGGLPKCLL
jgi:transposase